MTCRHTLQCLSCAYAAYRDRRCELPVKKGGTAEVFVLVCVRQGLFLCEGAFGGKKMNEKNALALCRKEEMKNGNL